MDSHARSLSELERRLLRLESIEAIKQLQVEYADACDANYDADRIAALFTENGVWDGGTRLGKFEGRTAIRDRFAGSSKRVLWALHFMIAPRITVNEDSTAARGSWYLFEPATVVEDGRQQRYWMASVYDIDYVRHNSGWLISRLAFDDRMRAPFESGWSIPETEHR